MSTETNDSDNDFISKYGGHWVLKKNNKILFVDRDFSVVRKKFKTLKPKTEECEIEFIETGDAVFYGIRV